MGYVCLCACVNELQVRTISKASSLMSVFGQALTYMIFLPPPSVFGQVISYTYLLTYLLTTYYVVLTVIEAPLRPTGDLGARDGAARSALEAGLRDAGACAAHPVHPRVRRAGAVPRRVAARRRAEGAVAEAAGVVAALAALQHDDRHTKGGELMSVCARAWRRAWVCIS